MATGVPGQIGAATVELFARSGPSLDEFNR
jgi:hypothetical protein